MMTLGRFPVGVPYCRGKWSTAICFILTPDFFSRYIAIPKPIVRFDTETFVGELAA